MTSIPARSQPSQSPLRSRERTPKPDRTGSGYAAVEYSGCHRWRASVAGAGNATRVRTVAWRLRYSASAVAMGLRPAMRPTTTGRERGSARYPPILTAVDTVRHHGREVAAAPFAVGHDIETGSLLHTDGADDRLIHAGCRFGSAQSAGSLQLHHVEQPARPRQTADDVGLQESGRYRLCSRSVRVTGRRHCQAPAPPGHHPFPAGGRSRSSPCTRSWRRSSGSRTTERPRPPRRFAT